MKKHTIPKFILALVTPQLAGLIGSLYTMPAIDGWYAGLVRPEFNPPNYVFGPVWTALYLLMGVSLFLVWQSKADKKQMRFATLVFFLQLALNSFWSIAFFGLQSPGIALIVVVSLWLLIVSNILVFYKISKTAAWLLVPYLLWVSFATYLNYSIWMLN